MPRGVLYPARLPTFTRLPAPEPVADLVRWFWIPQWDLAPGRVSRQHLIAFPACNLVVEPTLVGLAGPTTRGSFRDLAGRGWAVGALLRPAAVPALTAEPGALRDSYRVLDLPDLHTPVVAAMSARAPDRLVRATAAFADWLRGRVPTPGAEALLANAMADLVDSDPSVLRVEDAADRLAVSVRTLQRLAARYVGLSPGAMIRRRRLQEAAETLRTNPGADIASVAADLGYSDHSHLTNDFRSVLGLAPRDYRGEAG